MGAASTKIHGIMMTTAWVGFSSTGQLIAKHYRDIFPKKKIFGKDLWFVAHVTCMATAVLLTIAAFILIYVWEAHQVKHVHAYLGIIITSLVILQPLGGLLRPHPEAENRIFFNWGHWLGGNVIHLLAITNIYLALSFKTIKEKVGFAYVLTAYVLMYILTDFLISKLPRVQPTPLTEPEARPVETAGETELMAPEIKDVGTEETPKKKNWQQKLVEATPGLKHNIFCFYICACGLIVLLLALNIAGVLRTS